MIASLLLINPIDVSAQCSTVRTYDPNVCKFSGSLQGISGSTQANLCATANENPFDIPPSNGIGMASACEAAVRSDGNDCLRFYTKLQCSTSCPTCNEQICQTFCVDAPSICPSADAIGCFGSKNYCANSNTGCTNWGVDVSKIPASTATTTKTSSTSTGTGTTTTRTHTSTTATSPGTALVLQSTNYFVFGMLAYFVVRLLQ